MNKRNPSAILLAAAVAFPIYAAAAAAQTERVPPRLCACAETALGDVIVFEGIAIDAELTLDETGLSARSRQATIFRVVHADQGELKSPAKIWHPTDLKRCGVVFDYGKQYRVIARNVGGALETDYCLVGKAAPPIP